MVPEQCSPRAAEPFCMPPRLTARCLANDDRATAMSWPACSAYCVRSRRTRNSQIGHNLGERRAAQLHRQPQLESCALAPMVEHELTVEWTRGWPGQQEMWQAGITVLQDKKATRAGATASESQLYDHVWLRIVQQQPAAVLGTAHSTQQASAPQGAPYKPQHSNQGHPHRDWKRMLHLPP